MAYDEGLAARVRDLFAGQPGVSEKAMFGGLAFLVNGHMALAVGSRGELMVRADETTQTELLGRDGAQPTIMRGRTMRGWVDIDETLTSDDQTLRDLVTGAAAHARSLPPKR